jgi:predicted acetyltransferase
MPSHRRRGILREFMRRQLEDVHRRGEAIAALWASESAIYGRFGYGLAAPNAQIRADRAAFGFRDDPGPSGVVRLVDAAEAKARFPEVYERVRPRKPGMLTRTEHWWEQHRLSDPEHHRDGASRRFYALLELEGRAEGYALYRVKNEWEAGVPQGQVRVLEAVATSPAATRELWRFVFGIDLTTRVDMWTFDPQSPLVLMVADPRRLHLTISDGLWLRLVDVDAALRAREYGGGGSIVLEVRDEICPWNNGRYRAGEDAGGTDDEPELRLDVADLASAYLGGFDVARLAAAGRVDELRDGAVARATSIFRTLVPPHCPEVF